MFVYYIYDGKYNTPPQILIDLEKFIYDIDLDRLKVKTPANKVPLDWTVEQRIESAKESFNEIKNQNNTLLPAIKLYGEEYNTKAGAHYLASIMDKLIIGVMKDAVKKFDVDSMDEYTNNIKQKWKSYIKKLKEIEKQRVASVGGRKKRRKTKRKNVNVKRRKTNRRR